MKVWLFATSWAVAPVIPQPPQSRSPACRTSGLPPAVPWRLAVQSPEAVSDLHGLGLRVNDGAGGWRRARRRARRRNASSAVLVVPESGRRGCGRADGGGGGSDRADRGGGGDRADGGGG